MKEGLIRPRRLIDVKTVRELDAITAENGTLTIGATVRHRGVERSVLVQERCPLVAGVARHVANVRVRNVGTVGGNLAFADPHSDLATLFLALDGTLHLWSRRGARDVPLADFIRGPYETAREEDEVLTSVRLRLWPAKTASAYLKFGVYERPTLGVAVACEPGALRVTVGCVGPRPPRLFEVAGKATGRPAAGLADGETLHAVQAAFVEHGAVQCGFCTSGMLLSAAALLEENPSPTREQILHYLRGNLCRCTGYQKIIDAITSCARGQVSHSNIGRETTVPAEREPVSNCRNVRPDPEPLRVVGQSVRRVDAPEKVTGRARYVTDMELPGTLHAKLLRSPYPHAKILRVDVARARAAPGVRAVVTSADLDWCDPYYGPAFRDRPILAIEVARYEGEPVAAVVAESESAAAQALELIEIAYEELPAVTTLEEALAPGAPLVHTAEPLAGHFADLSTLKPRPGTNICHQFHLERGQGAHAFAGADIVVEDVYTFPRVQHYSMEPHAALAAWDEQGTLTVWASTQNPYSVRVELAKMFRVPMSRIRIIVPPLGGGFGGKTYAKLEPIVGALARMVGRPVRLALSVEEAFRTVRRSDASARVRLGFKRAGG